jgi:ubiquinone/menaquinone biosynthesis C-methylase UbiE
MISGQATAALARFNQIIGVDPSAGMIESAKLAIGSNKSLDASKFSFVQSSAEKLDFLKDNSVDLLIGGTQNHIFNEMAAFLHTPYRSTSSSLV